jgi:hypothetical protein
MASDAPSGSTASGVGVLLGESSTEPAGTVGSGIRDRRMGRQCTVSLPASEHSVAPRTRGVVVAATDGGAAS